MKTKQSLLTYFVAFALLSLCSFGFAQDFEGAIVYVEGEGGYIEGSEYEDASDDWVTEAVREVIVYELGVDAEDVTPQASLRNDLGANAEKMENLRLSFEVDFGIEIPEADTQNWITVSETAEYLKKKYIEVQEYEEAESYEEEEADRTVLHVKGNMMRTDEGEQSYIFRFDEERILILNHATQTYSETTFAEFIQMMQAMLQWAKEIAEESEAETETELVTKYEIKKSGKTETFQDYKCEHYLVVDSAKQEVNQEVWITKDFGKAQNFWSNMLKIEEIMGGFLGISFSGVKLEGIPVLTIEGEDVTYAEQITPTKLSASLFAAPADYVKEEFQTQSQK